jgi:hypothetical protein
MLPADQWATLEDHTVGEDDFLCYDIHYEAAIAAVKR